MTLAEVKALVEAGFTKEEIMSFDNPQNPQINTQAVNPNIPVDTPSESTENVEAVHDDQASPGIDLENAKPENTNIPENPVITELNNNITRLIKTIQTSNLANNSMDKPTKVDLDKQVDSIMGSIIRSDKEVK